MSNYSISLILHVLVYLTDAIFVGSKIVVPIIFLVKVLNVKITRPEISTLLRAVNSLILFSGVLFLIVMITNFLIVLRSGNEDEFGFMMSQITGSHWFQFVLPVIGYGILPQVFWAKKIRSSHWVALFIVLSWFMLAYAVDIMTGADKASTSLSNAGSTTPWLEYAGKGALYLSLLSLEYFFLIRRKS
ncbi:MAG: hypothetical protein IPP51_17840 [Bacteroidetes bacterium]|nr:hypothetical protein [Bacteroidota bacterium]